MGEAQTEDATPPSGEIPKLFQNLGEYLLQQAMEKNEVSEERVEQLYAIPNGVAQLGELFIQDLADQCRHLLVATDDPSHEFKFYADNGSGFQVNITTLPPRAVETTEGGEEGVEDDAQDGE